MRRDRLRRLSRVPTLAPSGRRTRSRIGLVAVAAAAAALTVPAAAGAQTRWAPCEPDCSIFVDSTADEPDAEPGDGDCATAGGACTLRAAVQEANALRDRPPFQSNIFIPPGTYRLTRHGLDDTADRGDLDIRFYGEIIGAGQSRTAIDGDHADRVFQLHHGDRLRIAHLAVTGGRATDGPGGAIRSSYMTVLEYLYLAGNEAVPTDAPNSGKGGAIAAVDSSVGASLIQHNVAQDGGGIWYHGAQSTIGGNTVVKNRATRDGGGILWDSYDSGFDNMTISGNAAGAHGGGVALVKPIDYWPLWVSGSTIASNTAPAGNGGGIWRGAVGDSPREFSGTIVARNRGGDCGGPGELTSTGWNIDGDGSCGLDGETDLSGVDPLLGPVAYNGGPTPTRALGEGSPAIDAWECTPWKDQRGAARPQGAACDIGAFEVGECCPALEPPYQPEPTAPPPPPEGLCGPIVHGTAGPDVLVGNERRNELHGRSGDDRLLGKANGDCLYGGLDDDLLLAGAGGDELHGGTGADLMGGGADEDLLIGGPGGDRLFGGPDEDRLIAQGGDDHIMGGDGYDTIRAGAGNDVIDTRGSGLDRVDCGKGRDRVRAERGEDLFRCEEIVFVDRAGT